MLLDSIGAAEAMGQKVLVLKPSIDDRYGQGTVESRFGGSHPAISTPIDNPPRIMDLIRSQPHDVLALDEVQFFKPGNVAVICWAIYHGIEVVACGLNRDYRGNPFPTMEKLFPWATCIETLNARCMFSTEGKFCGAPATMTQRLVNGHPDSYRSPTIIIERPGTSVVYQARCLEHWQVTDMPRRRPPR